MTFLLVMLSLFTFVFAVYWLSAFPGIVWEKPKALDVAVPCSCDETGIQWIGEKDDVEFFIDVCVNILSQIQSWSVLQLASLPELLLF